MLVLLEYRWSLTWAFSSAQACASTVSPTGISLWALCPSWGEQGEAGLRKRIPLDFLLQASSPAFSGTPNSLQSSVFLNKLSNCLYSYFAEDKHLEASDSNQHLYFSSLFGRHQCCFQLIFSFVGKAGSRTVISEFSLPVNPLLASLIARLVKNPPAVRETPVRFLGQEHPLAKGQATHSSILAWRNPWTVVHGVT